MAKKKNHSNWATKHFTDPFVKAAHAKGFRSRAAFKLSDIQQTDKLFGTGMRIVELGAAPGSWSVLLAQWLKGKGHLIAVDKLLMAPIPGVDFIQGDFMEADCVHTIKHRLAGKPLDWVVSDMAPNLSGMPAVDQPRSIELACHVLAFAQQMLKINGGLLIKVFQGDEFSSFYRTLNTQFSHLKSIKPSASRKASREIYLLARGLKRK